MLSYFHFLLPFVYIQYFCFSSPSLPSHLPLHELHSTFSFSSLHFYLFMYVTPSVFSLPGKHYTFSSPSLLPALLPPCSLLPSFPPSPPCIPWVITILIDWRARMCSRKSPHGHLGERRPHIRVTYVTSESTDRATHHSR